MQQQQPGLIVSSTGCTRLNGERRRGRQLHAGQVIDRVVGVRCGGAARSLHRRDMIVRRPGARHLDGIRIDLGSQTDGRNEYRGTTKGALLPVARTVPLS